MTHLQQVFINNIRFYRTKANFTQVEFAEEIGLSPNYLNAVEN
ncbi:helix-turn-helix transcriptional regulator [uncultured Treponema sp.]|nr:helix-turn-helix transcriptional regulator [uncultured Treponema sp.]